MEVALKTLEPYIKSATHLQTGKPFQNFGDMLSREAVANWLLCATMNAAQQSNLSFTTTNNLIGGDGNIHDEKSGAVFPTEHVVVPRQQSGAEGQTLILNAIDHKRKKGGAACASGKTLVVFVDADTGEWFPNKVAKTLPAPLYYSDPGRQG
jgi:hypothetical protein